MTSLTLKYPTRRASALLGLLLLSATTQTAHVE